MREGRRQTAEGRKGITAVVSVGLSLAALLAWLPSADAARSKLRPAADTFVSAARPSANFGRGTRLRVQSRPKSTAYLRFGASGASGPAVLRLYSLGNSRKGVLVRRVDSDTWSERGLSFSSAPNASTDVVRSGRIRRRHWVSIDVAPLLSGAGGSALDLAITAHGGHAVSFASRESRRHAPRLVLGRGRAQRPTGRTTPISADHPCGSARSAPRWQHVVWVVFENKKYADIVGSANAPYINGLGRQCGQATNFFAESHPSLPNYIAMTSGGPQGIKDDSGPSSHPLGIPSIFSQLGADWRALQESMPSNCAKSDSGLYAVRHNPAVYYTNVAGACASQDVPLADPPDLSARFTFITPNECNDMHSCPSSKDSATQVKTGDRWLSQWMPKLLSTPEYRAGRTAIVVTWDEDDYSTNQHIATIVVSPSTPAGAQVADKFDHYSLLRTTEDLLGLPPLGSASGASSMRSGFHL